ncbi:Prx [Symbiodinium necroappetens]|uniref:Prx protein n=1 Tax=Symbiodinium necroappetens TaxID=1628268 RepID=A0A813BU54_9DINO|nr:Prx [Symbiodinium necroappetens]|mmetsp:Transcript_65345/g.156074  ORF Transcript_65345/g.156074 Transcript_65345/m.156074 type:complete len:290 (-) Transcript_65345:126-995(-)|eukprot:CAMPEP_0181432202 /NCGR_PEP_ID=MMETSP1110-20121109/18645_1 /TAXON_ID=174948 /ORGANISM="Symbiodinium sp., Strain CCMP421" /LENGTH=289 /DNA_ID=CAMNT_0023555597 /DNA_START=40 /DNA_END=909 /DNA_ORIENTATION=+
MAATAPSGRRQRLLAVLVLVVAACLWRWAGDSFVAPKIGAETGRSPPPRGPVRVARFAGDSAAEDSVEISGFSGFVVGLAFLPHTCYALLTAVSLVRGESFPFFGFELLSSVVSLGLVAWSLGSFLQRGRGLPAGPLGLLGLSEGLSYLVALALLAATAAAGVRAGPSLPSLSVPNVSIPKVSLPTSLPKGLDAPSLKVPDVKLPDFKAKLPDVKVPDFKVPDIKVPDVKVPDVKIPDVKVPKLPEVKVPDVKLPSKEEKKEAPAPPAPPAPAAPKKAEVKPSSEDLFA